MSNLNLVETKMAGKFYATAFCLFLSFALDSRIIASGTASIPNEEPPKKTDVHAGAASSNYSNDQTKDIRIPTFSEKLPSGSESFGVRTCTNCHKKDDTFTQTHTSKVFNSSKPEFSRLISINNNTINKLVSEESGKTIFSRKYSPELRSQDDGFVPVPGPYGMKTGLSRTNTLKPTAANSYNVRSAPRNINTALKQLHSKNHIQRTVRHRKPPQSVQRRAQYRNPKLHDELTVKESITNENILGNGNFEIIKGGIYSDQDANEILGSRRISRGYGSFVVPTYQQSRFNTVRTVQFPPFYQRHVQNQYNPMYFPRAPY